MDDSKKVKKNVLKEKLDKYFQTPEGKIEVYN